MRPLPCGRQLARLLAVSLTTLAIAAGGGCATYSERMLVATQAVDAGDYTASLTALNGALGVGSAAGLPSTWGGNAPLAALERGVVLQSLERYEESARDFSAAEREIELLEFSFDGIGALSKYLYSDSSTKYRAPPSERLALNALNLMNYLAQGDLEGAAIEARRFQVNREYLASLGIDAPGPAALGAYLAGFVFEQSGEGDRALRYYEEAMARGALSSLRSPVKRLAVTNPYRGPQLEALLAATPRSEAARLGADEGEILVIVATGRVPHRVPERIPIGAAIGHVGARATFDARVFERAALKVLTYPALRSAVTRLGAVNLRVDGDPVPLDLVTNLGAAVATEYESIKPQIMAAGLTRLAARAALAEGARELGQQQSGLLGSVVALATEAALVAADRPDTRSWTMLPNEFQVARVRRPAGRSIVEVDTAGAAADGRRIEVDVAPGGVTAVVVTEPR